MEFDEREYATVRYTNRNAWVFPFPEVVLSRTLPVALTSLRNIAKQLIEKGLAGVVRHEQDDEGRSPDPDKPVVAEQTRVAFGLVFDPPFPRYAGLTF